MKTIILSIFLTISSVCLADISYVQESSGWVTIYNESGHVVKNLSSASGDLVGYSSRMFILQDGSWYKIYDENGRLIKTLSVQSVGRIIGVAGNTFTSENSSWIYTWDSNGRKLKTRSK